MASMATFNEERARSRPFGRCDLASMLQGKRACEKTVLGGCGGEHKPNRGDKQSSRHRAPVTNCPVRDEKNCIRGRRVQVDVDA